MVQQKSSAIASAKGLRLPFDSSAKICCITVLLSTLMVLARFCVTHGAASNPGRLGQVVAFAIKVTLDRRSGGDHVRSLVGIIRRWGADEFSLYRRVLRPKLS